MQMKMVNWVVNLLLSVKRIWQMLAVAAALISGVVTVSAEATGEKLVAIVNGIEIKQYEYDFARQSLESELANLSKAQQQQRVLQFLIDLKLMGEAARKDGFDKRLDYQQQISYIAEQTLNNLFFADKILKPIDDAALFEYYKQEMKKITPQSEMRARHILFDDEEKGKEVLKLLKDGADFAEMAETHSVGPSKTQGGDLGYFSDGDMVAGFSIATAMLNVGEFSQQLVKTKFGYHIIKLEDKRQKPLPSFEKVKKSLYGILVQERVDELSSNLRKTAKIELFIEQDILNVQNDDNKKDSPSDAKTDDKN